jgi:hypothetical protein
MREIGAVSAYALYETQNISAIGAVITALGRGVNVGSGSVTIGTVGGVTAVAIGSENSSEEHLGLRDEASPVAVAMLHAAGRWQVALTMSWGGIAGSGCIVMVEGARCDNTLVSEQDAVVRRSRKRGGGDVMAAQILKLGAVRLIVKLRAVSVMRVREFGSGLRIAPVAVRVMRVKAAGAELRGAVGAGVEVHGAKICVAREASASGRSVANGAAARVIWGVCRSRIKGVDRRQVS